MQPFKQSHLLCSWAPITIRYRNQKREGATMTWLCEMSATANPLLTANSRPRGAQPKGRNRVETRRRLRGLHWAGQRRKRSCQNRCARKLLAPNFSRRPSVDLGKDGVEPAQTAKARLHRDLGHGQARLVDEPFSPLDPR